MNNTYIYGIRDLEISLFIYIGKSNKPCGRFNGHMRCSDNDCVQKFVEEKGIDTFRLIILEKTSFFKSRDWVEREKFWIKKFREEGHPLCNKNDGGGGPTEVSEEAKSRMRESHLGKKHTEETKTKIGEAHTGKKRSEEAKANMSKAHIGKHPSEETRVKMSKTRTGKPKSEEHKAKISKSLMDHEGHWLGKRFSKEHKAKIGAGVAKSYPAFYNEITGALIPIGINLSKMCNKYGLNCDTMWRIRKESTCRSCDGWRLATPEEIEKYGEPNA